MSVLSQRFNIDLTASSSTTIARLQLLQDAFFAVRLEVGQGCSPLLKSALTLLNATPRVGGEREEFVCRVAVDAHHEAKWRLFEVVPDFARAPTVDHSALGEHNHFVKLHQQVGAWLVDRCCNGQSARGLEPKLPDNSLGAFRVKPASGFVQQKNVRLGYQLVADGNSFAFTAGNPSLHPATHQLVLALLQVKPFDCLVYSRLYL